MEPLMTILLATGGIAATIVVGFITVKLTLRRRYPGKLTFVEEDCLGLYDAVVRNLPDLSIRYRENPISEYLVLLKGYILNTGSIDITRQMQEDGALTITLPEGYKWIDKKIVSSSPNVNATAEITNDVNLGFDLGLFRVDEHARFEALAEVPSNSDSADTRSKDNPSAQLQGSLKFQHRVPNVQAVQRRSIPTISIGDECFRIAPFLVAFLMACLIVVILWAFPTKETHTLHYEIRGESGGPIEVKIMPQPAGTLKVEAAEGSFSEILSVENFFEGCHCDPKVVPDPEFYRNRWTVLWVAGLFGMIVVVVVSSRIISIRQQRRLQALLRTA